MADSRFSGLKAVYFDLDDTLCGYWDAAKAGLRRAFLACPVPGHTPEEMVLEWAAAFREFSPLIKTQDWYAVYLESGRPSRIEQMRRTLHRVGVDDPVLVEALAETYGAERNRALELFPQAETVLTALSARYPLGLITNGPADVQRQEIETLGIGRFFRWVFIEGEMGEGKPKPSVFRRAEESAGCTSSEVLYVGNSYKHDIQPTLAAGWRSIWVRRPTDVPPSADVNAKPEGKPHDAPEPHAEITELPELLDLLL